MSLSRGQINDAYQAALGRMPTDTEVREAESYGLDGDPGKYQLMSYIGGGSSSDDYVTRIKNELTQTLAEQFGTKTNDVAKYLKEHPLALDDAWYEATRKTLVEQVNAEPYYKEKLSNYLSDVETKKKRAQDDETTLLGELEKTKKSYLTTNKINYQQTRQNALEGAVDTGGTAVGSNQRDLNISKIKNDIGVEDYLSGVDAKEKAYKTSTARTLEDLSTLSGRYTTDLEREKQLRIETQVQDRAGEEYKRKLADLASATGDTSYLANYL